MTTSEINLSADPAFETDATGHLTARFEDGKHLLSVEPHDGGYHCFLSYDDKQIGTYKTDDAREVMALAMAVEANIKAGRGEEPAGFSHEHTHIHNPFADPQYGDWAVHHEGELKNPRDTYGKHYEAWLDEVGEACTYAQSVEKRQGVGRSV